MASKNEQPTNEEVLLKLWDWVEQAHNQHDPCTRISAAMLALITELRRRGYDRRLWPLPPRDLKSLTLTASLGISHHKAKVLIYLKPNERMVVLYNDGDGGGPEIKIELDRAVVAPELESLLERLAAHPID